MAQSGPGPAARPSVYDVAKLAGVSLGTVSNVLNRPERVAGRTRQRVEHAMATLGFVPNTVARSLARGTAATLGLIVGDLTNSLFVDMARGAERGAESAGLTLMLANADSRLDRQLSYMSVFTQSRVTGILLTLNNKEHLATVARHAPAGTPLVLLDFDAPSELFCSVSVDNELGGYLAARHLLDSGRRRLLLITGPDVLVPVAARTAGFRRAVAEAGLAAHEVQGEWVDRADGWDVGVALRSRLEAGEFDGIFAATDMLAAGLIEAICATVRIPQDVAVIGYDNNKAAWDSPIPISTMAQPGEEIGRQGALRVREEREALADGMPHQHTALVLPPTLIVRASSFS